MDKHGIKPAIEFLIQTANTQTCLSPELRESMRSVANFASIKDQLGFTVLQEVDASDRLNLLAAYAFLAEEYGKVLQQAGFAESVDKGKTDAISWLNPANRPAVD